MRCHKVNMNKKIQLNDLGSRDYKDTWDYQEELFKQIVDIKIQNRREETNLETPNYFLFVEHPHVYTLGKSGDISNLLLSEKQLEAKGATFYKINRGGDITYHGPAQIFLANGVPTSSQTPVSPLLLVPIILYSDKVNIITSSRRRKYL